MKSKIIILLALFCTLSAYSQGIKQSDFYVQRELAAPQVVKDRLSSLRKEIEVRKLQYTIGFTSVAEIPIEKITGAMKITPDEEIKAIESFKILAQKPAMKGIPDADQVRKVEIEPRQPATPGWPHVYGDPTMSKLDLRKGGFVTPVKDQKSWGSCWAFSAMAAYESNYKALTGITINASEEYVVNCSGAGGWGGGWPYKVFLWMATQDKNVADESSVPYTGPPQTCPPGVPASNYYAGYLVMIQPFSAISSVNAIKSYLCRFGVVSTTLTADDKFKLYTGGYFFSFKSTTSAYPPVNHAVAIIGWDDSIQCWLIKNSWGTNWGTECGWGTERGYMWIKYDSSNIGHQSCVVSAVTTP